MAYDMTPIQGSQSKIFIDEFELTQQSSGAEFNAEFDTIQYPIMGSVAMQQQVAAPTYSIPHHGYYTGRGASGGLGYFEETLQSRLGTTTPVTVTLVLGPIAYTLMGTWGSQLTFDAPVDGLITMEGNWSSPTGVRRGYVIPAVSLADMAVSPNIDIGAVGIANAVVIHAGGFADLTAGGESVTVNVQTSNAPAGTYATWLAASGGNAFKKPGAKLVTGATNPNRYVRVQVDTTTGVPGPTNVFVNVLTV